MEIEEVNASCSVRMNTGNYEGTEYFVSVKVSVDQFDDPQECTDLAQKRAVEAMLGQLERAYKARGKKLTREQICKQHGLPLE